MMPKENKESKYFILTKPQLLFYDSNNHVVKIKSYGYGEMNSKGLKNKNTDGIFQYDVAAVIIRLFLLNRIKVILNNIWINNKIKLMIKMKIIRYFFYYIFVNIMLIE